MEPCMEPCLQHPNLEHSMLDDHNAVHQIMFFSRRQSSCDNNTAFRNDGERASLDSSRWLPKHASKKATKPNTLRSSVEIGRWEHADRRLGSTAGSSNIHGSLTRPKGAHKASKNQADDADMSFRSFSSEAGGWQEG